MGGFEAINLPLELETSTSLPSSSFFTPLLENAVQFDVAVGYFTSAWIRECATGIAKFAVNGGKCRWLISPNVTAEDWKVISEAENEHRESFIRAKVLRDVEELCRLLEEETRIALSWLISDRIIEFKIAVPQNELRGMLHAKIGYLRDAAGNEVAFSGSYNLTGAAQTNWETIEIFSSLRPEDRSRVNAKRSTLYRLWEGEDLNLRVYPASDAEIEPFINITRQSDRPYPRRSMEKRAISIPKHFLVSGKLKGHQEEAIKNWFAENGRGIFNMATGSGKTVTALSLASRFVSQLDSRSTNLRIVICVPFRHLAEQWRREAEAFGFEPIMCFTDYPNWPKTLAESNSLLNQGLKNNLVAIVVNKTFQSERFQKYIEHLGPNLLLIADEMHNLGSQAYLDALPEKANFRLGLSATPVRHFDEKGTQALASYFGREVIRYEIRDAIEDGTLTPYMYYPILVPLTEEEAAEYTDLSSQISKRIAMGEDQDSLTLSMLLVRRARLLGSAENKLPALLEVTESLDLSYSIVYVGDGSSPEEGRQIDQVMSLLGGQRGVKLRRFTFQETPKERAEILHEFSVGRLNALVAVRCLDEGVDIPMTQKAFILASSRNPRQFTQRRGRVLRLAEGKEKAVIYDFIVLPPEKSARTSFDRGLVKAELERLEEFASSALNGPEASAKLLPIRIEYSLLET